MGSGVFSIGVSALQVAQLNLSTTAHNIANAKTEGYSRQRTIQAANVAVLTGSGYVGAGAHVSTIERVYSSTISAQVNAAQAKASSLDAYSTEISSLDSLLSDSDTGISSALQSFFASVSDVSSDPTSLTTRQTFVSAAQTLASRFQSVSDQITQQYESINSEIQGYVSQVASYSQQIATLNQQIVNAQAINGQAPNDLLDQRDQLVAELNKVVGVSTTTNTNGSLNVYFGNGQPLVTSGTVTSLTAVPSSADPSRLTIGVETASGAVELPESVIAGGSLGGIIEYRAKTLDSAASEVGRVAASVVLTVNAQQALGQDLLGGVNGGAGFVSTFFSQASPRVVGNSNNPVSAGTITASYTPASTSANGTFYTNLTTSNYRLQYDGTNLKLTRLSDNTSWSVDWTSSGATTDADLITALNGEVAASSDGEQGFSLDITAGTLVSGSTYLIQPTATAADGIEVNSAISSDVRLIAAAAPVKTTTASSNTGSASITAGVVTTGYGMTSLPVTLKYDNSTGKFNFLDSSGASLSLNVTVTTNGVSTGPTTMSSVSFASGSTLSFDGVSFSISGTPANGDAFTVAANTGGVSDSRNIALIGNLQTGKTMAGNTATFATIYAQTVSNIGNKANEVDTLLTAQQTVLSQAQDSRDSMSGVNLDEEAANLIQYQQAYQAASKVLEIASKLFDSILAISG